MPRPQTQPAPRPSLLNRLFGSPPVTPMPAAEDPRITDMRSWPWAPMHDPLNMPLGPLQHLAVAYESEGCELVPENGRLLFKCVPGAQAAWMLDGPVERRITGNRITAEIEIGRFGSGFALAGLIVAADEDTVVVLGQSNTDAIMLCKSDSTGLNVVREFPVPPHPSGKPGRVTLQAIVLEATGLVFANGKFLVQVLDQDLFRKSATTGLCMMGPVSCALERLTVEALDLTPKR